LFFEVQEADLQAAHILIWVISTISGKGRVWHLGKAFAQGKMLGAGAESPGA
jgi:hypothetical protein